MTVRMYDRILSLMLLLVWSIDFVNDDGDWTAQNTDCNKEKENEKKREKMQACYSTYINEGKGKGPSEQSAQSARRDGRSD